MRYYVDHLNGEIKFIGTLPSGDPYEGLERIETDEYPDLGMMYVKDGIIKTKSEQPSRYHVFDIGSENWLLNNDLAWAEVRNIRDQLLAKTDWMLLRAQERGSTIPEEWRNYRQALRDITDQPDPLEITWPTLPSTT